jgi:membrane protease subunit HflC
VQATGLRDSSMLTQDENIVDIRFTVQYRLQRRAAYLFENRAPTKPWCRPANRRCARSSAQQGRLGAVRAARRHRRRPGEVHPGPARPAQGRHRGRNVNVQNVQVPEAVQAAFNDAVKAGADRDRFKNEGQAYASDVIPKARGTASRLLEEAEGYRARVVAQAEGDAQRFRSVLAEYQKAPAVTRDRLYIETMQQVYSNVSKVMVDSRSRLQPAVPAAGQAAACSRPARRRPPAPTVPGTIAPSPRARTWTPLARWRAHPRPRRSLRQGHAMNRIGIIVGRAGGLMAASTCCSSSTSARSAVVYALGEIKEVITEPGLKFKLPPPFQNVVFLDKRIQTLDSPETRPIFTAEKKSLVIDWLVKWRITEPRQFIRNNGVDIRNLESRLSPVVQAAFNEEITKRDVRGVLSAERDKVMQDVRKRLADEAKSFGIEIVDVRIKRVDFVADITDSVYRRMESERKQVANELRSQGAAEGEKIRADADRQREVIIAEAYRDAQKIKGDGDAKASALYAEAFGRDPQFAQFYRSLEAYRATFRSKSRRDGDGPGQRVLQGHARGRAPARRCGIAKGTAWPGGTDMGDCCWARWR